MNGTLKVTVIGCRNLQSLDMFSHSDPYVRLSLMDQKAQTKTFHNDPNPFFHETFFFEAAEDVWFLKVCIMMDADSFGADEEIGSLSVPIEPSSGAGQETWYDLGGPAKGQVGLLITHLAPPRNASEKRRKEEDQRPKVEYDAERRRVEDDQEASTSEDYIVVESNPERPTKPLTPPTSTALVPRPPSAKSREVSTAAKPHRPSPASVCASSPVIPGESKGVVASVTSPPVVPILRHAYEMRRQRQHVEYELTQIQNATARIERAEKKVLATAEKIHRRADALLQSHERQETSAAFRINYKRMVAEEKQQMVALVSQKRAEEQRNLVMSRQRLVLTRRKEACDVRRERGIIDCKLHIQSEELRMKHTLLREAVSSVQERITQRHEAEKERRAKFVQAETERRIQLEDRVRMSLEHQKIVAQRRSDSVYQRLEQAKARQLAEQRRLENIITSIKADTAEATLALRGNSSVSRVRESPSKASNASADVKASEAPATAENSMPMSSL